MREGLGRGNVPDARPIDHISDAAIDRSVGGANDDAFQDYVELARPLWAVARARTAAFAATRRETDPEVVHALRVALRRLKALQWAYGSRIDTTIFKTERQVTDQLLKTAGSVRDWDVALSLVDDWAPQLRKMRTVLSAVRADAALFGATDLTQQWARVGGTDAVSANPPGDADATTAAMTFREIDLDFLAARLEKARRHMRKRVKQAERAGADHYSAMHAVRKAGKRVRDVHALIVDFTHTRLSHVDNAMPSGGSAGLAPAESGSSSGQPDVCGSGGATHAMRRTKKQWRKQVKRQERWAGRLLTKQQRRKLQRVQSRFGALNDVVHSAALLRTTAERSGRFAHTAGVDHFIRTLDDVACRYRRKALSAL
jgi:CHAD domain-containing protein